MCLWFYGNLRQNIVDRTRVQYYIWVWQRQMNYIIRYKLQIYITIVISILQITALAIATINFYTENYTSETSRDHLIDGL